MKKSDDLPRGLSEVSISNQGMADAIDLTSEGPSFERTLHEFVICDTSVRVLLKGDFGNRTRLALMPESNICVLFHGRDMIFIINLIRQNYSFIGLYWREFYLAQDFVVVVSVGEILIIGRDEYKIFEFPNNLDVDDCYFENNCIVLNFGNNKRLKIDIKSDKFLIYQRFYH